MIDMLRFSAQQRAFYCYLILSIWIFLLIAGMYKYIGSPDLSPQYHGPREIKEQFKASIKNKIIFQACRPLDDVVAESEGGKMEGWTLRGVQVLIRHGDRGPLDHVRGIADVDCGINNNPSVDRYVSQLANLSHATWPQPGPFHGFPLLPATPKACELGQLTQKGVAQLLKLGEILHELYSVALGFPSLDSFREKISEQENIQRPFGAANNVTLKQGDIVIISTRYRRTFQSAMALMFSMLPAQQWAGLNIQESLSLAFCFSDCACGMSEHYRKRVSAETESKIKKHIEMKSIIYLLGQALLETGVNPQGPSIRDALLALLCHGAPLPCHKTHKMNREKNLGLTGYQRRFKSIKDIDGNEIINIDQDTDAVDKDNPQIIIDNKDVGYEYDENRELTEEPSMCIQQEYVNTLFSYLHSDMKRQLKSQNFQKICLLKAYGLIKNIVQIMLSMVSQDKPKFVLYSTHDKTLQFLSIALGFGYETPFIPYASKIVFEIYKKNNLRDNFGNILAIEYYFRALFNGKDVTSQLSCCNKSKVKKVRKSKENDDKEIAFLCPIESIVRFIHDDYFFSFNATNFKDACSVH